MELVSFFSFYTLLILFLHLRANNKSSICIVSQQSLFLKSKKKKINKEIEEIKIQKKKRNSENDDARDDRFRVSKSRLVQCFPKTPFALSLFLSW